MNKSVKNEIICKYSEFLSLKPFPAYLVDLVGHLHDGWPHFIKDITAFLDVSFVFSSFLLQ